MKDSKNDMLDGDIPDTLIRMAIPMFFGMIAIMLFQIVDTYFVGQLGSDQLAAMGFVFPVIFIMHSLVFGIGIGASAVISIAMGKQDMDEVRRLTTHSLILGLFLVILYSTLGMLTIDPLFSALGAEGQVLELITEYMSIWYLGIFLLVIPMLSNSAIRATGDTKTPAIIMSVSAIANVILDPAFIFGFGPIPALGLQGAAIATVISWVITFIASLYVTYFRLDMIRFVIPTIDSLLGSFRQILHVGLPATSANLLGPLTLAALTMFVSEFGVDAVAAWAVVGRIESLTMIGVFAMASALMPFVGQNFGAKNFDRIKRAVDFGFRFTFCWGLITSILIILSAGSIARLFNSDPAVISNIVLWSQIVPLCWAFWGIPHILYFVLNAIKRPMLSAALVLLRFILLMIPLAYIAKELFGLSGVFLGISSSVIISAIISYYLAHKTIYSLKGA